MKMKKLRKDQRGFSLLELVIVIALTGLITAAITTTIFQVFNMNTRTANRMAAVSQVQHAGKLVSEDILEAQIVVLGENSGFPLTLNRIDPATNNTHKVIYDLVDMTFVEYERLQREHYLNDNPTPDSISIVSEYIDPDPDLTSFVPDGDAFIFTVTATVGNETETRVYKVTPRPG